MSTNSIILFHLLFAICSATSPDCTVFSNMTLTPFVHTFDDFLPIFERIPLLPAPENVYHAPSEDAVPLRIVYELPVLENSAELEDLELSNDIKSMKIAGFVAQLILFLFAFTLATVDFDVEENENVVYPLHRAREIQMIPLPATMQVHSVHFLESDC
uniref:Uncharacterized protein n=1 Tax=Caenorhabditis japonica TaxID=281687 RepID=A0A8R1HKZ8_CAEJA